MEHILYKQVIKRGYKAEYKDRHAKCWYSLMKEIKASGIRRELIWLDGNNIYIYMMGRDINKSLKKLTCTKAFKAWNESMKPLLSVIQDASADKDIKYLNKVFDLESQLGSRSGHK